MDRKKKKKKKRSIDVSKCFFTFRILRFKSLSITSSHHEALMLYTKKNKVYQRNIEKTNNLSNDPMEPNLSNDHLNRQDAR